MNTVMLVSLVLCAAIAIWGVADPDSMTGAAQWLVNYSLTALDWYFLALCTAFLVIMGFMAFSKYGNIKLGADDDEPEFSTGSWVAMLFAAGMGSGLLFWGVAEPIYHFMTPPVGEGETAMAARNAMVITNLHWGLHAWSIYGCCALVIAYFTFRLGLPSMVSTPILVGFKNVFGKSTLKQIGNTADILAVIAVIFGLAGSLAMGTLMVRSGMAAVFDTSQDVTMSMIIIAVMTVCFLLSACTGVDKGIKILSNINMIVAILILLVVLFGGPTAYLFQSFIYSIGDYLIQLIPMSFKTIFIARISRGRTIREFVIFVVGVPTIVSMLWFAAFGGAAIHIEMFGAGGIADKVFADVAGALFGFFEYFPGTTLLNFLAVCLIFIFLVTSADSGTFVISMMTSSGSLNPPTKLKLTWGLIITGITVATIVTESVKVAKVMAITGAIPFTFIIILQLAAFFRIVREDPKIRETHTVVRQVSGASATDESAA
jgi:glycine betaine transporter